MQIFNKIDNKMIYDLFAINIRHKLGLFLKASVFFVLNE